MSVPLKLIILLFTSFIFSIGNNESASIICAVVLLPIVLVSSEYKYKNVIAFYNSYKLIE